MTTRTATEELRAARRRSGMTIEALADAVGKDKSTVSRWLGGKQQPDFSQVEALANAMAQPIVLTFGPPAERMVAAAPIEERLDAMTGMLEAIADALRSDPAVATMRSRVVELGQSQPPPDEAHRTADRHPRDTPEGSGR